MKSDICNTNGHLIDVITMPTAHWEAGNRPCKRDKIKWDSSCSNSSQISGSKLQRSTCFNSHCRYLLLCGFRDCSCEDAEHWVVKRSRECWAGKGRLGNESERFCQPVLCNTTSVTADQMKRGDGEECNECDPVAVTQGDAWGERAKLLPGMVCSRCEVHKLLWGVF